MIKDIDSVIKLIAESGFNNEEIYKKLMNNEAGTFDESYYKENNLIDENLKECINKLNVDSFDLSTGMKRVKFILTNSQQEIPRLYR